MTENIPPHPNPLPPRGEGVRSEKFTPLLSESKKEVKTQPIDEKKLKKIFTAATATIKDKDRFPLSRE